MSIFKSYKLSDIRKDGRKEYIFRGEMSKMMIRYGGSYSSDPELYIIGNHPRNSETELYPISFDDRCLPCVACRVAHDKHHLVNCVYMSPLKYRRENRYDENKCRVCNMERSMHNSQSLHKFIRHENKIVNLDLS